MSRVIYDSRDPFYKEPFGAVTAGQEVRFSLYLPKLCLSGEPLLKIFGIDDPGSPDEVPMSFSGADLCGNIYTCIFTPHSPALLAYYFEVPAEDGAPLPVRRGTNGAGILDGRGDFWQLTVYDSALKAPDFLREGVLYQIFPDRFHSSGTFKENVPYDRVMRADWGGIPYWRPNERGEVTNSDYFGGDLKGIGEKLCYLESIGVTAIYLNPIFEAHSNHRYNTADYRKIDPTLGTNEDFRELCEKARGHGISIILDGVFSHTGSDSVYFNKQRRYGDGGAFNDPGSPYRKWYSFSSYPEQYDSWWGFKTLPNVEETQESYLEFICGEDGILRYWLGLGAKGFRLDVADELPDAFLDRLRSSVKGFDENSVIIGEVWEDASNKISYGKRRRYLLGNQLDSVMNYPFMSAVICYISSGNSDDFYATVMTILENYPKPAIQCLMNSLSTHDTVRAITVLSGALEEGHGRDWQEAHNYLPADRYHHGCRLFALASILQFGLPGIPCVYYADEAGMCGYSDPFNRICYPWGNENRELLEIIRALGIMRREHKIFAEANFIPVTFSKDICCFIREGKDESILFAVNRGEGYKRVGFLPEDGTDARVLVQFGEFRDGVLAPYSGVVVRLPARYNG